MLSILSSSAQNWRDTTVFTPNGTSVEAGIFIGTDFTDAYKEARKNYYLNFYGYRISFIGDATRKYQCYTYAWDIFGQGPISGDTVFVWNNGSAYWNDGSYVQTASITPLARAVYIENGYVFHAAVVINTSGWFISKWGDQPLFLHSIDDCPFSDYTEIKYYVRNCDIDFHNKTVNSYTPITGCGTVNISNVSVVNNAMLQVEAPGTVSIEGPFIIQAGASFKINK